MPKISDLTSTTSLTGAETFPLVQAGVTKKTSLTSLFGTVGNVRWYGATGSGTTDDTAAIQACIDDNDIVYFPPGTYKVTATAAGFDYGNTTVPVYRALNIDKSNLFIHGDNAVLELYGVDDPGPDGEINYVMSTAKNMTLGTLSNITIKGLKFEFNPSGKSGTTYRTFHIVGARGVFAEDLYMYSSGSRAGATLTLQNCEQVRFSNLRFRNTTQGMNFSYVDDVQFDNIMMDYFSEGIDFDRMVSRCVATNVTFTSTFGGLSGQCWDLNSVRDSTFKNISAYRCGNVLYNNFKQTTPPTYAEYVNNDPVVTYTPSRNNVFDGINVHTCSQDAVAIVIGDDANTDPGVLTRDVVLRNVNMVASGSVEVRAAINVLIDGFTAVDALPSTTAGWAVIVGIKGVRANAQLSLRLRNITIKNIANSQDAIRISGGSEALLDGLFIENYPLDAVEFSGMDANANISVSNAKFLRTVDTVVTGTAVKLVSFGNSGVRLHWENVAITQYTTPLAVSDANGAAALPSEIISLGQQAFTSGTKRVLVYADELRSAYFSMVKVAAMTAAADAVNYVAWNLRGAGGASVCSGNDTAGYTTGTPLAIGFTPPEALAAVDPGTAMYLEGAAQGTGRTLDGFAVIANYVKYAKV